MAFLKGFAGFASFVAVLTMDLQAQEKQAIDMIVYGDHVVTMQADDAPIQDGAVAVHDGEIIAVGKAGMIDAAYNAERSINGKGKVVLPGLVNGHTHSAMVLFRGMADDLPLMTWLQDYIFPMEGRYVDASLVEAGSELACWEMIKSGVTSFVDMYFYPDTISDVVVRCGMRAVVAAPMIDYPSPGFEGWSDSFDAGVAFVKRWKGKHPRIIPALAPHAPYTVSKEHLDSAFKAARDLAVPVSIHVAEDLAEVEFVNERYGKSSIELLSELGMLTQSTIAAHVVWPSDSDIVKLAGSKAGAIHNPTSNMKAAAGISPVPKMLEAGVTVGLGTDGAASNNDLNLWQEMRFAALLHKGVNRDATLVSSYQALDMATRMGARAAGFGDNIGSLKPGSRADIIQVSFESPRFEPTYNVVSHLVYVATAADVKTSIIDGQLVMLNGKVMTIDIEQVRQKIELIADKVRADIK
ncbi:amidohydrolase [Kordiimonas aquimaris]|uniref:amidohydrolase n=1 Tax=Kordiimonas aquimaris TaxID=707591 RepID=UPI0021D17BED|nr:amidohydrolase [Kordiimonas aquimaris]